jgi:hypothetical protein
MSPSAKDNNNVEASVHQSTGSLLTTNPTSDNKPRHVESRLEAR